MSVYDSNISKNKIELKQPQYKDIDKRYFDQLIQLKVPKMVFVDPLFNMILLNTWPGVFLLSDYWNGKQGPR